MTKVTVKRIKLGDLYIWKETDLVALLAFDKKTLEALNYDTQIITKISDDFTE